MHAKPPTTRRRVPFRVAATLVATAFSLAAGQIIPMPPAVPSPNGDSAFVGEVVVTFPDPDSRRGNVFYTLDGTDPTNKSTKYEDTVLISKTTTLKSIRYWSGNRSAIHTAQFTQARLPQPVARSGGRAEFATSILCTLALEPGRAVQDPSRLEIYYTTRPNSLPDTPYTQPLAISRTTTVLAVARHPDYDVSPPLSVTFRKLAQVDKPALDPLPRNFSTPTLRVGFATTTPDAYFLYTTRPGAEPDTLASSLTLVGRHPNQEFIVRVKAAKAGMISSAVTEGRYVYVPAAARPTVAPAETVFTDTQRVALHTSTPGASIYYTLNGNLPTPNAGILYDNKPILLDSAYRLRAIATHPQMPSSGDLNLQYELKLTRPTPSQGGGDFTGTLNLKLTTANPKATILYTLEGRPGAKLTSQARSGEVIPLSGDTTHVWAVAVLGAVMSDTAKHSYYRRATLTTTPQPTAMPEGQDFLGSVTVSLVRPTPEAVVHFTLDGTDPTTASPRYAGPITLTRTTVVKAIAAAPGLAPSTPIRQVYGLTPSRPVADRRADTTYEDRVEVRLSTSTPGARIYYKTGHWEWNREDYHLAVPYPTDPAFKLVFVQSTRLTAVAVTGSDSTARLSEPMVEGYTVITSALADSLQPSHSRAISGAFEIMNRGATPVSARIAVFDDLGLKGFKDPSHSVTVAAQGTFPRLSFRKPGTPEHAVYLLGEDGVAVFQGRGDSVDITRPGTYFAAIDTLPPSVSVLPPAAGSEGTQVRLRVSDNVRPATCAVTGSGQASPLSVKTQADGIAAFMLRNPAGAPQPLWFHADVSDGRNTVRFPKAGRYVVEQSLGRVASPVAYTSGRAGATWDMVGFPLGRSSTLTWGQVRDANRAADLSAMVRRGGDYALLVDADTLEPGMGFWLGSPSPTRSVVLPRFVTGSSDADGLYRITLRPGWNLVTNPSLETLYWPATTSHPRYGQMRLRRLWGYDSTSVGIDWTESETLEPWKGYWVYLLGISDNPSADTLLALSPVPPVPGTPALKASAPAGVDLRLDFGRSFPIRLGAEAYGHDAVGVEDEPVLPDWRKLRQAWSARERARLMTDVVRFRAGEVLRWKLVLEGSPAPGRDSLVRVAGVSLPAGYEAWAWSPARNLKVRLEEASSHSVPGPGPDTLFVFAGPAAKLAGVPELARAVDGVPAFASGLRAGRPGYRLFLALPSDALVQAELFSAAGRRLATLHSGRLGSGHHELRVPAGAPGLALVRLRARGAGWSADRVHKLAR